MTVEERMTYKEALARIPARDLPDYWVGSVEALAAQLGSVSRGAVDAIAHSPGGRAVSVVAYGEREALPRSANFNSAVAAREPSAYSDRAARERPVLLFAGPVHGHETEGVTGLVNLIHVMETGRDLRGRAHAELRALGDACRLLIVPCGNPDGMARFVPGALNGMRLRDIQFWGQGTWADGTLCGWPGCKRRHPMRGDEVGWLGCYFNDLGVNPMHDEWFAPMSEEAPALLALAREEAPDLAVSLHSHQRAPAVLRPAYVPLEVQAEVAALSRRVYDLLDQRGLPHGTPYEPQPEQGSPPAPFNLTSALYHTSGATVFTFECPHGIVGPDACPATFDKILDIQLALYEAMMVCALAPRKKSG